MLPTRLHPTYLPAIIYQGVHTTHINNLLCPLRCHPWNGKTEALYTWLPEIFWQIFNFSWWTRYSPKCYQRGLDIIIHKEPNDWWLHIILPITLFDIDSNMQNNHVGRASIIKSENLDGLVTEQYGNWKFKAAETQALNTRLFYDLTRQERNPALYLTMS